MDRNNSIPCSQECIECLESCLSHKSQETAKYQYKLKLSYNEAKAEIEALVSTISTIRERLLQILNARGDDVITRWRKGGRCGSQAKREALLQRVAPDLPKSAAFFVTWYYDMFPERSRVSSRPEEHRHKLLLPWLTVEMLVTHQDALLALAHYRTAHGPEDWAAFDRVMLEKAFLGGEFDVEWADGTIAMSVSLPISMCYQDICQSRRSPADIDLRFRTLAMDSLPGSTKTLFTEPRWLGSLWDASS